MADWPNGAPGSDEALDRGCLCAVLENGHGRGRGGDGELFGWWITEGCPVHAPELEEMVTRPSGGMPLVTKWDDEADPAAADLAERAKDHDDDRSEA